jgi:hypothetical protein
MLNPLQEWLWLATATPRKSSQIDFTFSRFRILDMRVQRASRGSSEIVCKALNFLVGAAGIEPATN